MNRSRILVGLAASFGFSVAAACGSSSSNNGGGNGSGADAASAGTSSGSSGSSGASSGDDSGGTGCASGQALCLGIVGGSTCVADGGMCLGTMVLANECSATSACPDGQVCCSSYVGADGGVIVISDAGVAADAGTGTSPFNVGGLGSVAVQCMTQCPSNALSSQVCVLEDDGGSPTTCPEGTTCQDYLPPQLASTVIPNTLCLQTRPTYDAGGAAATDGGAGTGTSDAASVTDAAPE